MKLSPLIITTSQTVSLKVNDCEEADKHVLSEVLRVYGVLKSTDLRKLTHSETPLVSCSWRNSIQRVVERGHYAKRNGSLLS